MSNLQYLIDYLADEETQSASAPTKKYVLFNDNFIEKNFFLRDPENTVFGGISGTYITTILLGPHQSLWYKETPEDFVFYVKKTTNIAGTILEEYHELGSTSSRKIEYTTLDNTSDLTEIPLSYKEFKYHIYENKLYILFEEFFETFIDNSDENFYYTRDSLKELEDTDYDLYYKDSLGDYDDTWNNIIANIFKIVINQLQRKVSLDFNIFKATTTQSQRKVTLDFNKTITEGRVYKFPTICEVNTTAERITIDYNFFNGEPIIPSKLINTNYAIRIEFNSYQAFLAFCDQVYFSKGVTFDLNILTKVEKQFFVEYDEIVKYLLERTKNSSNSLDNLIDIVWYLPQTYLQSDIRTYLWLLWDIMIGILEEDDVNNRGLNKEDLIAYIIVNLSKMLSPDNFLELFLLNLVDGKNTPFKKLFEDLQTDDFRTFVNVFWSVWSQSSYAKFDPKKNPVLSENEEDTAPIVLPYKANKKLGFYHTNAEIGFSDDETILDVVLTVDTGIEVTKVYPNGTPYKDTIKEDVKYNYHVFHPIAIINEEAPEFLYDKAEGQKFTVLPAFVLLANQHSAFWRNIQTGGEYLIDIITTFSGIGNLAKFRHLSKIAKLGHKLTFAQKAKKVVTGVNAVVEISSGTINALLKLTGLNDTKFGQSVSEILFYLELFALGIEITDYIGGRLATASKTLLDHPNFEKYLNRVEIELPNGRRRKLNSKEKSKFKNEIQEVESFGGNNYGGSIIETSDPIKVKQFEEVYQKLIKLNLKSNPEKAIDYLEEAMPYFNHKVVDGKVIQIGKENCGDIVLAIRHFLKEGELKTVEESLLRSTKTLRAKLGNGTFQETKLRRLNDILEDGQEVVVYGVRERTPVRGPRGGIKFKKNGHYFYAIKRKKKLYFYDGQTGEVVLFANTDKFDNFYRRGYNFGFEYLLIKN